MKKESLITLVVAVALGYAVYYIIDKKEKAKI